jgi:hypothetical protein
VSALIRRNKAAAVNYRLFRAFCATTHRIFRVMIYTMIRQQRWVIHVMAPDGGLDMKSSARVVRLVDVIYAALVNVTQSRSVEISMHQILWDKKSKALIKP